VASTRENGISCNYEIEVSNSLLLDMACLACHHEYTKIHEGIDYLILSNKIEPILILMPQNYVIKPQFHIIVGMINEK
jgi:hypothetical protein